MRRRKRPARRLGALAALVGGAACGGGAEPAPLPRAPTPVATQDPVAAAIEAPPQPPPAPTELPAPKVDPLAVLAPFAFTHESAPPRELYTWTTDEQVEALKKDPTLLVRTESPTYGVSFFDQVMDARAETGDKVAKLIRTQAFAKARFAWPHAWPTLLGFPGETYGQRLIRVVLRSGSLLVVVRDSSPAWRVVDLDGSPRTEAELLSHPELLAGVYFVHDAPLTPPPGVVARRLPYRQHYREFVLVNESRIELYETGTPAAFAELDRGIRAVESMLLWVERRGQVPLDLAAFTAAATQIVWPGSAADQTAPLNAYMAALAFPNELYVPSAANLRTLVAKLSAVPRLAPAISYKPTTPFPGAKALVPIPKPVPKPRRRYGTFGGSFL